MAKIVIEPASEMAILRRVIDPEQPFLSEEAARSILRLTFDSTDRARMNQLAAQNRAGTLKPAEEEELEQLHSRRPNAGHPSIEGPANPEAAR